MGTSKNEVSDLLLDSLSEENNLEKSLELLDELLVKELCCRSVFDGLLDMFCKKGKFSEALASIDEVKKRGLTLGFDTCKTLILGLKHGGHDNEVAWVLEKMVKFGWVPSSTSVNELISQEETDMKEVNSSNESSIVSLLYGVNLLTVARRRSGSRMVAACPFLHMNLVKTR